MAVAGHETASSAVSNGTGCGKRRQRKMATKATWLLLCTPSVPRMLLAPAPGMLLRPGCYAKADARVHRHRVGGRSSGPKKPGVRRMQQQTSKRRLEHRGGSPSHSAPRRRYPREAATGTDIGCCEEGMG